MKILITGASSGIGAALSEKLVKNGHIVLGLARREWLLKEMRLKLGENFRYLPCDISDENQMKAALAKMKKEDFVPDIAVLNAAVFLEGGVDDFCSCKKSLETNFLGAMFWTHKFLPAFTKRNKGVFVAVSSVAALRQGFGAPSYSASKAALSADFNRKRFLNSKTNVKFSTVHFGPIKTDMWRGVKSDFLVPSAEKAANYIIKISGKKAANYYYPFLTTFTARFLSALPERIFYLLSKTILKISKN